MYLCLPFPLVEQILDSHIAIHSFTPNEKMELSAMRNLLIILLLLTFSVMLFAQAAMSLDDLKRDASKGDTSAMFELASRYYHGEGIAKDPAMAAKWFLAAAEKGHAASQFGIAACYEEGLGVAQSQASAVYWMKKSADQGYYMAQANWVTTMAMVWE